MSNLSATYVKNLFIRLASKGVIIPIEEIEHAMKPCGTVVHDEICISGDHEACFETAMRLESLIERADNGEFPANHF